MPKFEVLRSALRVGIVVTVEGRGSIGNQAKRRFHTNTFVLVLFLLLDIGQTYRAYIYEQLRAYSQGTGSCVKVW